MTSRRRQSDVVTASCVSWGLTIEQRAADEGWGLLMRGGGGDWVLIQTKIKREKSFLLE